MSTQAPQRPVQDTVQQATRHLKHEIVIVGGGSGGITVAARLLKGWGRKPDIAIIDPSENHYYQPAWTLVVPAILMMAVALAACLRMPDRELEGYSSRA